MKISGNQPPYGHDLKQVRESGKEGVSPPERPGEGSRPASDRVDLSTRGRELSDLVRASGNLPEVRVDKVEAVTKAIKGGTYTIDPLKVAKRILDELL